MQPLSLGKLRGFQQCTSAGGIFTCLALDHRQNLRKALNPSNPDSVTDEDLTRFKMDVTSALADMSTAVLLDPEYGAGQAIASGVLPAGTGLVVALESTGYTGDPTARQSQILPGWSVEKTKKTGASMAKLLVYYHPDSPTAHEIEQFVKQIADECRQYDLGLMLEPLSYSLDPASKSLPSSEKRRVVVETARRLTPLGVDLLKAEFPLDVTEDQDETSWRQSCTDISSASQTPWILLSAAVDFENFLRQVDIACDAGASGIAVGRAVWKEAVSLSREARNDFLVTTARQRLVELHDLCKAKAKPFIEFYSQPPVKTDWYKQYGQP